MKVCSRTWTWLINLMKVWRPLSRPLTNWTTTPGDLASLCVLFISVYIRTVWHWTKMWKHFVCNVPFRVFVIRLTLTVIVVLLVYIVLNNVFVSTELCLVQLNSCECLCLCAEAKFKALEKKWINSIVVGVLCAMSSFLLVSDKSVCRTASEFNYIVNQHRLWH